MAKYKLTVDGKSYQVTADTPEAAHSALMKHLGRTPKQETNLITQSMSGLNEGLANLAGLPVDMVTGGLNLASKGINRATGVDLGQIENPVGGSQGLLQEDGMGAFVTDVPPQTTAQRVGRRVGQEVGASLPMAAAILGRTATAGGGVLNEMTRAAQANPGRYAAAEAAGAIGSGGGAAIANEAFPGNPYAELAGQLMGGGAAVAAMTPPRGRAPSMDELRTRQSAAYDAVDTSPARLAQSARDRVVSGVQDAATQSNMDEILHPRAARVSGRMNELEPTPSISEVDRARRVVARDVAGSPDRGERAIGISMREALDREMSGLSPQDVTGTSDPQALIRALGEGRDMTRRILKSEMLQEALTKAEDRAATSGTGGNLVNAQRQNVRAILDSPTKRRGFSQDEIKTMRDFVRGGTGENLLRILGRFSPTAGYLPAAFGAGSAAAFGIPGAIPSAIGMTAKGGAEAIASKNLEKLAELIRNGAPLDPRKISPQQRALILALSAPAASTAAQAAQQ